MKRITFLFLINILLVTAGCYNSPKFLDRPEMSEGEWYLLGKDIAFEVRRYYYFYGHYPERVEELVRHMENYDKNCQVLYDEVREYLIKYKKDLTITTEGNRFILNDKVKGDYIELELDYCKAKKVPQDDFFFRGMAYRYFYFDTSGQYIWDDNAVIAYGIESYLMNLYQREVTIEEDGELIPRYIFFQYDRKGNITPLCDEDKDIDFENDPYIITLLELLDKYIFSNKKVYSVKILQSLRKEF